MRGNFYSNDDMNDDLSELVDKYYNFDDNKNMSNLWALNWTNVSSAVVSAVIVAVLQYIANLTSIANLDWHTILGTAITVGAVSLLKAFGTTDAGNFVGVVPVAPAK